MVLLSLSIWILMVGPVCVLSVLFRGRTMFVQYPQPVRVHPFVCWFLSTILDGLNALILATICCVACE
jgi:hypothetical protein